MASLQGFLVGPRGPAPHHFGSDVALLAVLECRAVIEGSLCPRVRCSGPQDEWDATFGGRDQAWGHLSSSCAHGSRIWLRH